MTARKRLSPGKRTDWEAAKLGFLNGTMSPAEHAATHGVTVDAMRARVARGKWFAERLAVSQAAAAVAQARMTKSKAAELAEFDAADARMSQALRMVAARMLHDGSQPGKRKLTPSEARTIASLAESAQKIGRLALGGATDNSAIGGLAGAPPVGVASVNVAPRNAAVKQAMLDYLAGKVN